MEVHRRFIIIIILLIAPLNVYGQIHSDKESNCEFFKEGVYTFERKSIWKSEKYIIERRRKYQIETDEEGLEYHFTIIWTATCRYLLELDKIVDPLKEIVNDDINMRVLVELKSTEDSRSLVQSIIQIDEEVDTYTGILQKIKNQARWIE